MNEKHPTLNEIASEATRINDVHRTAEKEKVSEAARYDKVMADHAIDRHFVSQMQTQKDEGQAWLTNKSQEAIKEGAAHLEAHQDAYHDLAVIEASMAGVAINVKHPVVLGEATEEIKDTEAHK